MGGRLEQEAGTTQFCTLEMVDGNKNYLSDFTVYAVSYDWDTGLVTHCPRHN